LEKHWKSVIHRSICDYFFEAQSKVGLVYQLFIILVFAVSFRLTLQIYFRTVMQGSQLFWNSWYSWNFTRCSAIAESLRCRVRY